MRTDRTDPSRRRKPASPPDARPAADGDAPADAALIAEAEPSAVGASATAPPDATPLDRARARLVTWLARPGAFTWLLIAIALLALVPRLYGLDWDADNHLHPDERQIVFVSQCLTLPDQPRPGNCQPAADGPGWFLSASSPLNPHFFAYGSLPLYLLAAVAHFFAWLTTLTGGRFLPPGGGTWDDFNSFTLIGRALSALFDVGSVLLVGLIGRRLAGRWAGLLAAAFAAAIPLDVQLAHFYAVDTVLLFFVLLTLLACVLLAQGAGARGIGTYGWASWGAGLFVGASFGLAMATKVSALPLLAPIGVALLLRWRRRGFDEFFLSLLALFGAALVVFVFASPYALIDYATFQQQVSEQTALSQGRLDYPYVRQFADTAPYLYQLRQMLLYDVGVPLGALGIAGFGWAVSRLWRTLNDDWAIVVVWIAGYFAVVGGAYMKFSRYMLPLFAPLALCGAAALAALAAWGYRRLSSPPVPSPRGERGDLSLAGVRRTPLRRRGDGNLAPESTETVEAPLPPWGRGRGRGSALARRATAIWGPNWWRVGCAALGAGVLATTLLGALALANLYSAPNTRVQASEWLYDHVRPGAVVTSEIWDDPLPIGVPPARIENGVPLTHAGHVVNPGQYTPLGLDLYAEDTPAKAQTLAAQLATADVVVISSQRLLRSIPKLPDRYPMTTRYYQLLFDGQLGFTLAAHFEAHPHLFGYTLDDSGADESFSVYDHPPVWIFTRAGAPLTADDLRARLTDGVRLPAPSQRPGSMKPLLLDPAAVAANDQSAPLGVQFPADSLPNRIPLPWWLLIVELLGVVSFPLAFSVFPGLRDRGWGLAKLLGLLALGYLAWLPASVRLLPFDRWVVVAAFAALALAGAAVGWRRREALWAFVRARWRLLLIGEVAFVAAFLFFAWIRALDPDLWHIYRGGEKPMEFAYLDAILRSRYLPPADPWFAGGSINYYYYGQFLIAALIKLTGVAPATAFNLAIPLLFALSFSAAFSVVAGLTGRAWTGLAAGLALVVVGNLDGLWQLLGQWHALLNGLPVPQFDYWASSRVIPCLGVAPDPARPCYQTTINEFPYWSFLYADLHAHLINLPVTVFVVGCCASLLASARAQARRWKAAVPTLAALAVALGAAWCINTWDLPTYALLVAVALGLRHLTPYPLPYEGRGRGAGWRALIEAFTWPTIRNYVAALALILGGAYALYAPFHATFQNFVSGVGTVTTPTAPYQFFTLFGIWLFLAASFFYVELRDRMERAAARALVAGREPPLPAAWRRWGVLAAAILLLAIGFLLSLKLLLLVLLVAGLALALDTRHGPAKLLTYCLLLLGLGVALGVELVYVRDFLDDSPFERMNTVFKFYYQVWTLLALGGALALAFLARRLALPAAGPADAAEPGSTDFSLSAGETPGVSVVSLAPPLPAGRGGRGVRTLARWLVAPALRGAWLAALIALLFGSSVFLVEGTQARLQDPAIWAAVQPPPGGVQPQGLSLDGMAYMRGWYPGDYAAITWMNAHVAGMPTIVEASSGVYNWHGRVSVYTGLPDVVQLGHENEQRYGGQQPYGDQVGARQRDVEAFWSTEDPAAAATFLREYRVRFVYIGDLERTCYVKLGADCAPLSAGALAKFDALRQSGALAPVYAARGVVIYQVTDGVGRR